MISLMRNYENEMTRICRKYGNRDFDDILEMDIECKVDAIASWFAFEMDYGTPITECGFIERMKLMKEWSSEESAMGHLTKNEWMVFQLIGQYMINETLSKQTMKELLKNDVFTKNEFVGWVKCEGNDFKYKINDCGSYYKVAVRRYFVSTTFNVFKMELKEYKENEKMIVAVC